VDGVDECQRLHEPMSGATLRRVAGGIERPAVRAVAQNAGAVVRPPGDSVAAAVVLAVDAGGGVLARDPLNAVARGALAVDGGGVEQRVPARCPDAPTAAVAVATVSEAVADAFENAKALQKEGLSVVPTDIAGVGFEPTTSGL
jgi:hypothetical protein